MSIDRDFYLLTGLQIPYENLIESYNAEENGFVCGHYCDDNFCSKDGSPKTTVIVERTRYKPFVTENHSEPYSSIDGFWLMEDNHMSTPTYVYLYTPEYNYRIYKNKPITLPEIAVKYKSSHDLYLSLLREINAKYALNGIVGVHAFCRIS